MSQQSTKKLTVLNIIAMLAVFTMAGTANATTPAIQRYIEAFPNVAPTTIRMVNTFPMLFSSLVMFVAGSYIGNKITYKHSFILAYTCIAVGGVAPFFLTGSWTLIMVCRGVFGLGIGFVGARSAYVMRVMGADQQSAFLGYGTAIGNITGIVLGPIVGALTDIQWNYSFLVYALGFVILLIVTLFLKEPEKLAVAGQEKAAQAPAKLSGQVYALCIFYFLLNLLSFPLLTGLSTHIMNKGLGTAAQAGVLTSCFTVGGALFSMFLGKIHEKIFHYTFSVFGLLLMAGQAIVLFSNNFLFTAFGVIIFGGCYITIMMTAVKMGGVISDPRNVAKVSMLVTGINGLSSFFSSYMIDVWHMILKLENPVVSSYVGCLIGYAVLVVVLFFYKFKPYQPEAGQQ